MAIEQRATSTLTKGIRLQCSSLRTRVTLTCYRIFSSGAVTTFFFYVLGLSRLQFEHPTFSPIAIRSVCIRGERSNRSSYRRGRKTWSKSISVTGFGKRRRRRSIPSLIKDNSGGKAGKTRHVVKQEYTTHVT